MELVNDILQWATYNNEAASVAAGMIACGLWSAGYVLVSESRRHYRNKMEEREHIKPLDKDVT